MPFREEQPGLLLVQYAVAEELAVAQQRSLLARLEQKAGPVVLVFDVGAGVRSVPIDVPTWWLGVTARDELRIVGMGIVTNAIAVRAAAKGFSLANLARRVATQVQTFERVEEAVPWAVRLLTAGS